ncbi:DUF5723 family protein [Brumimicrobium aurantiacum]|uniref:DUF5723 domain-containing protein n=1 Tax=Brumimicrobium aurantiacum TaxID=1737063 RepID=A0A3E1F246_9FLAO|nr:DUF5723 family protein [Brumimicrobium aurantiacum]RFC55891.1 hypothetical protein DXU93_02845 [Brumimicrobium aurantiacum]
MKIKYINNIQLLFLTALLSCIGNMSTAQRNYTMYGLDNIPQAHVLNPAYKPNAKVFVSIPVLSNNSFGASNSGFSLNDLLTERPQDDSLNINPSNAIGKMSDRNFLTLETYNEVFAFGFRVKKNYFSFGVTNRLNSNFVYTKDLFTLITEGNGKSLLGKRASLDETGINLNSYLEYAVGFNREINDKLSVGGRVKFLSGMANVDTRETKLGLHTDATTFNLTFDGSATINTSGINSMYDSLAPEGYTPAENAASFKNFGIALDLGAQYKINDKISVSASLLDLGYITWKEDNSNFVLNEIDYRYEGIDLKEFLTDSTEAVFENLEDTLRKVFSGNENNDEYKSSLATRFYLNGSYQLTNKIQVAATLYNEILESRYRAAAIVSGSIQLKNWLTATLNYSQYARSFGNIGAGVSLRGGPVQFFVVTDNVLGFFAPTQSKNFHASFGINLMFGKPD